MRLSHLLCAAVAGFVVWVALTAVVLIVAGRVGL